MRISPCSKGGKDPMRKPFSAVFAIMASSLLGVALGGGCGAQPISGFDTNGGSSGGGSGGGFGSGNDSGSGGSSGGGSSGSSSGFVFPEDGGTPAQPCTGGGLTCYTDPTTSISGHVYDPAGKVPLYNVVVFIPNDPLGKLPAITPGTKSCNTCDVSIGNYVPGAVAVTDSKGYFQIKGAPVTTHVPLVVQTGKWRREIFLPSVTKGKDNVVPDPTGKAGEISTRLPQSRTDFPAGGSADLPQMLLMTGGCDDLGCFMKSMGIADSEFSAPRGGGRLDVYSGSTLAGTSAAGLSSGTAGTWGSPAFTKSSYEYYDIALFSCECHDHQEPAGGVQALHDWLDEGGKVFASHYNYTWFASGPAEFQSTAAWIQGSGLAVGGGNYSLDTSFPKGVQFHDWLNNVGAASGNSIALSNVAPSVGAVNAGTTRWIYDSTSSQTKYLSFLTPVGGIPGTGPGAGGAPETNTPQYCGKAVFTDLHTSSSLLSAVASIPGGCSAAPLTAQQKALEFLFFDLSACVAPDTAPPPPPPPPTVQ
jgi:hypothetical protein